MGNEGCGGPSREERHGVEWRECVCVLAAAASAAHVAGNESVGIILIGDNVVIGALVRPPALIIAAFIIVALRVDVTAFARRIDRIAGGVCTFARRCRSHKVGAVRIRIGGWAALAAECGVEPVIFSAGIFIVVEVVAATVIIVASIFPVGILALIAVTHVSKTAALIVVLQLYVVVVVPAFTVSVASDIFIVKASFDPLAATTIAAIRGINEGGCI